MAEWEREIFIDIEPGVRIRYCRGERRPVFYAVMLEVLVDHRWEVIRLWDNAHTPDEHHEHEYTRVIGKQPAKVLEHATTNDAMASAIRKARNQWSSIIQEWQGEQR